MESNNLDLRHKNPEELYVKLYELAKKAREDGNAAFERTLNKEMQQIAETYMLDDEFLVASHYL